MVNTVMRKTVCCAGNSLRWRVCDGGACKRSDEGYERLEMKKLEMKKPIMNMV